MIAGNIKGIDRRKIDSLIDWYKAERGERPEYLITSFDTLNSIDAALSHELPWCPLDRKGYVTEYHGIKMAVDESLEFGEVRCVG